MYSTAGGGVRLNRNGKSTWVFTLRSKFWRDVGGVGKPQNMFEKNENLKLIDTLPRSINDTCWLEKTFCTIIPYCTLHSKRAVKRLQLYPSAAPNHIILLFYSTVTDDVSCGIL